MPALNTLDTERFTLGNGLKVVLCHAPRLKRCAASLRVAAGSHDVSAAWPGLAHFLEHLFFLGTERFCADQKLMTFVQRHGGQINASTRERTTDFFFELPVAAFAEGVERLCDMLANPRMNMADQLREREVLHAEFIAWSRDAEARHQTDLLTSLNPRHPLRGFHAGNRYSLVVPNPAFQQALKDFYVRFYQAGQLTLCLAGPQPLVALRELATQHGAVFRTGEPAARQAPPLLAAPFQASNCEQAAFHGGLPDSCEREPARDRDGKSTRNLPHNDRLHLLFACEGLPAQADEAVAYLCHWLNTPKPGGLKSELVNRGLISSLKAAPLYQFNGQLLLDIDFQGSRPDKRNAVARLFFSWLAFFKLHWPERVAEFGAMQQRRLQTCGALELAHHYCRDLPGTLSRNGRSALEALIAQLTPESLLGPETLQDDADASVKWQLPPPNPFLLAPARTDATPVPQTADSVVFHRALPTQSDEAAVFLRWQLADAQPRVWRMLNESLQTTSEDARQAGVDLSFSAYGPYWEMKLNGIRQPMVAIIEHVLRQLVAADAKSLARYTSAHSEPPLIPIRQLLKVLPDRVVAAQTTSQADDPQTIWSRARWSAFVTGLPPTDEPSVRAALSLAPGSPQSGALRLIERQPGKCWLNEATESSEDAVLVFCPTAGASITDEAAWRMLGHLVQGPFYQRLRVELQLGYAVFSGLRQIGGLTGLLFGVQSPACGAEQLVRHIETLIDSIAEMIAVADLEEQKRALIAQFDPHALPNEQLAQLLWQAHLAGHDDNYLIQLRNALAALDCEGLTEAARNLAGAAAGWLILANRPAPSAWPDLYLNGNGLS
ncbi:pyrroloquinoline quinone biosynthesis protein PqqF [Pseudomonas sp. R1-18]|uniref:pyrroloquinoline quinone biosynthesis protein PqqF n=1 Tax=Pseudomonas sp. R1-18 TaxID=1632772 RepID=UPI003DAA460D